MLGAAVLSASRTISPTSVSYSREEFYSDCLMALERIPTDPPGKSLPAEFTLYNRFVVPDIYTLPRVRSARQCFISVFLEDNIRSEYGSWTDIRAKLMAMNELCYAEDLTQAEDLAGNRNKIELKLFGRVRYRNNGTAARDEPVTLNATYIQ